MPAKPTIEQLRETAQTYDLHLSDADLESFTGLMGAVLESYRRIDQLPEPALTVRYPRSGGYRPAASPAAATPPILVRCSIHTIILAQQAVHPVAAPHSLWPVNAIWRLAETRAARFASRVAGAGPMVLNQPTALFPIRVSFPSSLHSTIPGRLPPPPPMSPCCWKPLQARMALIRARKMSRSRHTPRLSPVIPKGCASAS